VEKFRRISECYLYVSLEELAEKLKLAGSEAAKTWLESEAPREVQFSVAGGIVLFREDPGLVSTMMGKGFFGSVAGEPGDLSNREWALMELIIIGPMIFWMVFLLLVELHLRGYLG
jgi:hypothetical protein